MIMVTQKGIEKNPELPQKIDQSIFPGLQGGPHNHTTAAIAVALGEANKPDFKIYARQIVKNAQAMADEFIKSGISVVSGGTDNHLLLLDLTKEGSLGAQLEFAMDVAHMTANKNTVPADSASPYYPSGLRLGTPALTTRGMKEKEMRQIAQWITEIIHHIESYKLPSDKTKRAEFMNDFKKKMTQDLFLKAIAAKVVALAKSFPVPGI